jgi:hypothetical protein
VVPLPGWFLAFVSPPQVQIICFAIFLTLPPKNRFTPDEKKITISSLGEIPEMKKARFTQEQIAHSTPIYRD